MRGRRVAWLAVLVAVVPALAVGSAGFDAAQVDRDVSVSVAERHDRALVPIRDADATPVTGGETAVVEVRNRFDATMSVRVEDGDSAPPAVSGGSTTTIAPNGGDYHPVTAHVDCGPINRSTVVDVVVVADAADGDLSARVDYRATVDCGGR